MYYNVVVVVYWRLINPLALLETVALAKALPSVALGKGPSVNFFMVKALCRVPFIGALGECQCHTRF
jgi:hypothetical protein